MNILTLENIVPKKRRKKKKKIVTDVSLVTFFQ